MIRLITRLIALYRPDKDARHIQATIKAATARRDMRAVSNGHAALMSLRHAQLRQAVSR